jgi:hypothetical protein
MTIAELDGLCTHARARKHQYLLLTMPSPKRAIDDRPGKRIRICPGLMGRIRAGAGDDRVLVEVELDIAERALDLMRRIEKLHAEKSMVVS